MITPVASPMWESIQISASWIHSEKKSSSRLRRIEPLRHCEYHHPKQCLYAVHVEIVLFKSIQSLLFLILFFLLIQGIWLVFLLSISLTLIDCWALKHNYWLLTFPWLWSLMLVGIATTFMEWSLYDVTSIQQSHHLSLILFDLLLEATTSHPPNSIAPFNACYSSLIESLVTIV